MAFQSFEDTALRLADRCGILNADFFEMTGTMFCNVDTPKAALDLFQAEIMRIFEFKTVVTPGRYEHSIDFVA